MEGAKIDESGRSGPGRVGVGCACGRGEAGEKGERGERDWDWGEKEMQDGGRVSLVVGALAAMGEGEGERGRGRVQRVGDYGEREAPAPAS